MKDTFKFVLLIAIAVLTLANTVMLINWEVRAYRIGKSMQEFGERMSSIGDDLPPAFPSDPSSLDEHRN